ncbi:MAG TPA: T9SS type A sorting domain-containing protein [Bacteroidia bacterium]|nr:T9SS type A sorting domain-containing protein [Bacteroidia bacterium]HNU34498.1 T9SS type A sorting domain-containing protein [Bacteroidia bacterium]
MKRNFSLVLLLILPFLSFSQWTSNTALNTTVKDAIGTGEETPLSATRADGKTYISFFESTAGGYQLRMQLLDTAGNKLWSAPGVLVSNLPQSTALFRYDLKVDQNGDVIVAFQDIRTAGNLNVVVYKIDVGGNPLWGLVGISLIDPVSTEGLAPAIGITNSNNVIVGWSANAGSNKWVAIQKISPAGNILWANTQRVIDSTNAKKFSRPTFVAAGTDDAVMLYVQETGSFPAAASVMYAQRFDTNGAKLWATPVQVSNKTIPFFFFPAAVSDNNDGFFVAFNTGNAAAPSQTDVYVQHVSGTGTTWNTIGNVACALANTQHFVGNAKYDTSNNSFWVLLKVTDISQGQSGVYMQKIDAATGNVLLGANSVQLLPVSAVYNDPRDLSITNNGVITFYSVGSNSLSQTLAAIKNDFSGNLTWTNPVTICSNTSGKDDLTLGLFYNNQVVAVWDDTRNDYGVYAQNITNDGLLGVVTSLYQIEKEKTFVVYPNPFKNNLHVADKTSTQNALIKVYDIMGEEIFWGDEKTSANINTQQWSAGVYFVRAGSNVIKVVKQ